MTGKGKSRWADSTEDAVIEAKLKKEKEEKKRLKAEKARKLDEGRQAREAALAQRRQQQQQAVPEAAEGDDGRPAKRRKVTPERESRNGGDNTDASGGTKLLRFPGGSFGKSRSVENYDKLNDIEEGAYGFVARAKEIATGKVVALKRLKIEPNDRNGLPVTGLREIQILKDCDHRNVVELKEVVVGEDTRKIEKYVPACSCTPVRPGLLLKIPSPVSSSSSNSSNTTSSPSSKTCPSPS